MAHEGADMQRPTWFSNNLTLGNVITLCVLMVGGAVGYGQLTNRIENMEAYRVERTKQTDEKFANITRALENLPNLAYRVTAQEEGLKATNQRVDSSLATISSRLAEINQALGALDTKVQVLTQRLELTAPQRRAEVRPSD